MITSSSGKDHRLDPVVNFATIKQQVNIERILDHYGLLDGMRRMANDRLRGHCPFHEDTEPSFITTPTQRGFHCFGCGVKGNVITFVKLREQIATGEPQQDDLEAARLIQSWFCITPSEPIQSPQVSRQSESEAPQTVQKTGIRISPSPSSVTFRTKTY